MRSPYQPKEWKSDRILVLRSQPDRFLVWCIATSSYLRTNRQRPLGRKESWVDGVWPWPILRVSEKECLTVTYFPGLKTKAKNETISQNSLACPSRQGRLPGFGRTSHREEGASQY